MECIVLGICSMAAIMNAVACPVSFWPMTEKRLCFLVCWTASGRFDLPRRFSFPSNEAY